MEKLYDRIDWENGTTPALNDSNLNSMSKAIDDIDDRVVAIAGDLLTVIPQIQTYLDQADDLVEALELMTSNPPYIGTNGHWYTWDMQTSTYVDSGVDASITIDIADITMLAPDATPYVTNTGTDTDPIFHLFIPRGYTGNDGISPDVTITTITGGHRVTITDADHPSGQSFDVMDGAGAGDMKASVYDPQNAVANAGGIPTYVSGKADKVSNATNGNLAGLDSNGNLTDSGKRPSDFDYSAGTGISINPNTREISSTSVSVDHNGTASDTGVRKQRIGVNGTYYDVDGSVYMEQTANSASFVFTNSDYINADSYISGGSDTYGDNPSNVVVNGTAHTCTVTFDEAKTRTVRIYIK